MPKIINYPNASFEKSLEIAKATFELGGTCNEETCAEKLNKKVSGGFKTIIASAQKFGLIDYHKGEITVSPEYELIEHAYNDEERSQALAKAFFEPDVFQELFNRFEGKKLPIDLLERMLIREYEVNPKRASRVAKYFVDGLEFLDLIDATNNLKPIDKNEKPKVEDDTDEDNVVDTKKSEDNFNDRKNVVSNNISGTKILKNENNNRFVVHLKGPGMDSIIEINDEDDLTIVDATLNKIRKKIKEMEGDI
jgi:hypothetical protein